MSSSENPQKRSSPEQLIKFQSPNRGHRYMTPNKSKTPSKRCRTDSQELDSKNIYGRITHYN